MKNYEPYFDERNKRLVELVKPSKKDKILVIGTGIYPKIEYFLHKECGCDDIFSGDIDKKNLDNGKKVLPNINFGFLDAQKKFPFPEESFDVVVLTEVLEHLKSERIALREIRRVLKKSGCLVLSVPKRRWFNVISPITHIQHYREYSEKSIKRVLEKHGFSIERLFVGGTGLEIVNLWTHLILKYSIKYIHPDIFFRRHVDRTYRRDFRGGGFDILVRSGLKKER